MTCWSAARTNNIFKIYFNTHLEILLRHVAWHLLQRYIHIYITLTLIILAPTYFPSFKIIGADIYIHMCIILVRFDFTRELYSVGQAPCFARGCHTFWRNNPSQSSRTIGNRCIDFWGHSFFFVWAPHSFVYVHVTEESVLWSLRSGRSRMLCACIL